MVDHLQNRKCRMVTLTIRTFQLTLKEAVLKLYTSFSKLRQTTFWRTRVAGGCAVCEIKRTRDGLRWHPHLHVLTEGTFIPQGWLAKKWGKITGDSYIVHVQPCDTVQQAAKYITSYLSKLVPSPLIRNHNYLVEAIQALEGRRMVATFGSWRGLKLTRTESTVAWSNLCTFRELTEAALHRDADAKRILSHLIGYAGLDPSKLDAWLAEMQAYHEHCRAVTLACNCEQQLLFP